ncbi:geranylgeranyl reductase family protein [Rhodococcus fascians]|uniref:geranylgeranyl reductase family protein n=1 Tax=Nocardiaceae TaxID=85025 RepID=UPI000B9B7742|nr:MULTISPECIES: geranylgeranyl reductase family protein [Rhodococcus]MBM7243298.1 geranylgeranyl reductase family protein [Rhodococcus fascians]MBY3810055.1 geranylgeranyl reductase family protein [Rhodococcus fascians]MBY3841558.1 geranylgeranyl reductase family protein [Rhodococcus fascians]MBY3844773.1 geranylgeranyl reductase family protein [Rhodococcus fascians]MBY3850764.1 geranylgeranyl reductase family protein [Rhodococcus fascians]
MTSSNPALPSSTDVLVVGAGPAGSSAAAWAARSGRDVVLADAAVFPRDKTCGDGLTPRAVAELDRLGLGEWVRGTARNRGLRLSGFGQELELEWPSRSFPAVGSAVPRTELDDRIRRVAVEAGAVMAEGAKAVSVTRDGNAVRSVTLQTGEGSHEVACRTLIVADGVRSTLGKQLGRQWHRDTAFGVAARAYITSARSDDEWISSHLELRDGAGTLQPGYGWVFPLNDGNINIGVGTLATATRPAPGALRPLLDLYTQQRRSEWELTGELRSVASALLPMGGAVSGVAGVNWAIIGDAAACVNPLNGEGIDYGLEGGRMVVDLLDHADLTDAWPTLLREHYGQAFSIARRLAGLLTVPRFLPAAGPVGMRSRALMKVAVRCMGNLVTEADSDLVARTWRTAGTTSLKIDSRPPFS